MDLHTEEIEDMLTFTFDKNSHKAIVWPYMQNADYLVVVVGEARASRVLGIGLCRRVKEHLVIFTGAYEFDALFPVERGRFVWEAFRRRTQTRCEVKDRLGELGFDPCVVDRLWPEKEEE